MRKIWTGLGLIAALLLAWPRYGLEVETLLSPVDERLAAPLPEAPALYPGDDARHDSMDAVLYFRYMQTDYLAQEARTLDIARDETVEMGILRAVMAGPRTDYTELTPLFFGNVPVMRAQRDADGLATVVFGQEFLEKPQDAPQDWEKYEYWVQEIPRRRRLAIQAVANALTENARCSGVQFLISAAPGDAQGTRMRRALFFPGEQDVMALLDPLPRSEAAVLTPRTALVAALDAWQRKDWIALYAYLRQQPEEETALPAQTEFLSRLEALDRTLLNYKVSIGTVSVNGAQATLCVDLKAMRQGGQTWEVSQVPVAMVRERDCWKLSYDALLSLMEE